MNAATQFSVSTWNYLKPLGKKASLMHAVQEIKSQGFGIELWLDWSADPTAFERSKWSHLKETCKNPVGLSAHSSLIHFFDVDVIRAEIELCEAIEARPLVVHPRSIGFDMGTFDPKAPQKLDSYDMDPAYDIVSYAAEKRVLLALENGPLDLLRHVVDAFENRPEKEFLKICVDTGHANLHHALYESPALRFLEEFRSSITQIHLSDNWGKADNHNLPGEGTVDWNGVLKTLADIHYKGRFVFELNTPNPSDAGQRARDFFSNRMEPARADEA